MNITPLTIYLWQLADVIRDAFGFPAIVLSLLSLIGAVIWAVLPREEWDDEESKRRFNRIRWAITFISLVCSAGYVLIPSSKTIAMMVVIPKIAESKVIQKDLPDIYNAAIQALKDQLQKK